MSAVALQLLGYAESGEVEALEAAWLEALDESAPVDPFVEAFGALPDEGLRGRFVSSMQLLLETIEVRGDAAEVLKVVRVIAPYRKRSPDLHGTAARALRAHFASEPWLDLFIRLSGIEGEPQDLVLALKRMRKLAKLLPGRVVLHRTGWGEGLILEHHLPQEEFSVRFRDGLQRAMPFTTGLDVLTVLKEDDLRARLLTDVEGLQREAESSPELLVRAVARLGKGRASAKDIKTALEGSVIPARAWAGWWRKAKAAALHDPMIAVESPARPVFVLRERALSPEEELTGAMDRAGTLAALLAVVRGPLSLDAGPALTQRILERLAQALGGSDDPAARVEAALLLSKHGGDPELGGRVLDEALARGLGFAELSRLLPSAAARRDAFDALVAARPQLWSDAVIGDLGEFSGQLVDAIAERLVADGRGAALANRFRIFLMTPSRQPEAVLRLAKSYAAGRLQGVEGAPTFDEVVMGLLHLAETQAPKAVRKDKAAQTILAGLEDVLIGRRALLVDFAKRADRQQLEAAMAVMRRSRGMPDRIVEQFVTTATRRFSDLAPLDETPFWQRQGIFCTRDAIAGRQAELRDLIEVKLPENREAIGRAAAYGDLSENFEWASAIEQQRQLTERIAAMEAELKLAQPIEEQPVSGDVVSPGTRVRYDHDGQMHEITVLGPWDRGEGVVSYRAPLAAGMLGRRAGDEATLELPSGTIQVRIADVASIL